MKNIFASILLFSLSFILLFSCTVEKKLYSKGYHIEWRKRNDIRKSDEEKRNSYFEKITISDSIVSDEKYAQGEELLLEAENVKLPNCITHEKTPFYKRSEFQRTNLQPVNDDTLYLDASDLGGKMPPTEKEIKDHKAKSAFVIGILLFLLGCCVLIMITEASLAASILGFLGLLILIVALIIAAVALSENSPKRKFDKALQKAVKKKEFEELSPEEQQRATTSKKRKAAIFFAGIILVFLGLVLYENQI